MSGQRKSHYRDYLYLLVVLLHLSAMLGTFIVSMQKDSCSYSNRKEIAC